MIQNERISNQRLNERDVEGRKLRESRENNHQGSQTNNTPDIHMEEKQC
jgi:hypothetical protein